MSQISPGQLLDFSGKAVLVTGGSRGIGAGVARRFAEAGADLAINYLSNEDSAVAVADQIERMGRTAITLQGDVRLRSDVERMIERSVSRLGRLDILINNAGVDPVVPMLEMTDGQWADVVETGLRGVFLCTQIAASVMIRQPTGGAIVNIASIEAENPADGHSHYGAAKAGVVMHTRNAARELGPHGIRVNCVSPGLIDSGGLEKEWPDGVSRYTAASPLGRTGTPEDVADACLFLASPAARWITGANLVVDGGVLTSTVY
jgi:NAD(P)-dependent dehydrogenase (short-subunit alcohol dehydrogenase family)